MHTQPTRTISLHPVPVGGRLLDLEDAADWLQTAVHELAAGDTPAALSACHYAVGKAEAALDSLVALLSSNAEAPPEDLHGFCWPGQAENAS